MDPAQFIPPNGEKGTPQREGDQNNTEFISILQSFYPLWRGKGMSNLSPLEQLQVYKDTLEKLKKAEEIAKENLRIYGELAVGSRWEHLDSLDPEELANKVRSEYGHIAQDFELTCKAGLTGQYIGPMKRTYAIFKQQAEQLDKCNWRFPGGPAGMVLKPKRARLMEDISEVASLNFSIKDGNDSQVMGIPKTALLAHQGFSDLLKSPQPTIELEDMDIKSFNKLKMWLEAPSPKLFEDMECEEILEFMIKVNRFKSFSLHTHCQRVLSHKIDQKTEFQELFKLIQQLTDLSNSPFRQSLPSYGHLEPEEIWLGESWKTLYKKLKDFGLTITPKMKEKIPLTEPYFLSSKALKVTFGFKFLPHLDQFFLLNFLKGATIDLDLTQIGKWWTSLTSLSKGLPQTESISILLKPARGLHNNLKLLHQFNHLKKVKIQFSTKIPFAKSLQAFKECRALSTYWELKITNLHKFTPVNEYEEESEKTKGKKKRVKKTATISIDDLIELETLKRFSTIFSSTHGDYTQPLKLNLDYSEKNNMRINFNSDMKKLITDAHIQRLIEGNNIDPETTYLNLSNFTLSNKSLALLVKSVPKLERLNLIDATITPQTESLDSVLSALSSEVKQVSLSLPHIYQMDENSQFLSTFGGEEKNLIIQYWQSSHLDNPPRSEDILKYIFKASDHLKVKIFWNSLELNFDRGNCTLKLNNTEIDQPQYNDPREFFKICMPFAPDLEIKMRTRNPRSLENLASLFPLTKKIKLIIENNVLINYEYLILVFLSLTHLQMLTIDTEEDLGTSLPDFTKSLLQSIPEALNIDIFPKDDTKVETFIANAKNYWKLFPSQYDPFHSKRWTKELRSSLTEEQLLLLKPDTEIGVNSLDLSGMMALTNEGLLNFLENMPKLERLNLEGCKQISDEAFNILLNRYPGIVIHRD